MTVAQLKKEGKIVYVRQENYTGRLAMFDDGRVVYEGEVNSIRSKYVWIDEENGIYYMSLIDAYEDRYGRKIK